MTRKYLWVGSISGTVLVLDAVTKYLVLTRIVIDAGGKEGGPSPLAAARDELRKAMEAAAAAPKLFDVGAAATDLQQVGFDAVQTDVGKLSSQGTFSAAAAFGLAAGGVNNRQVKAVEATAQNTRQLVDHARRGRLVFG